MREGLTFRQESVLSKFNVKCGSNLSLILRSEGTSHTHIIPAERLPLEQHSVCLTLIPRYQNGVIPKTGHTGTGMSVVAQS